MVKFLDGATESHWVRLSETFILVWLQEIPFISRPRVRLYFVFVEILYHEQLFIVNKGN